MTCTTVSGALAGVASTNYHVTLVLPIWMRIEVPPCLTMDPDVFFPETYGSQHRRQIDLARRACASCPIQEHCLEWAVDRPDLDGIWAGTTPLERRRIRVGRAA